MALTDQLHKGMVIRHEEHLYMVLEHRVVQAGKQKPTVHVKLRDLKGGHTSERTLDQLGKIEEVPAEVRQMQYLYPAGQERVFMDTGTFEQYSLGPDVLRGAAEFLVEQETYRFLAAEDQVVDIQLPEVLVLEVADTAPVEHGGGHTTVLKEAALSSGLVIHVPLFIKTGDKIRVNTQTRTYLGKEH